MVGPATEQSPAVTPQTATSPVDAFILFNERENIVESVDDRLNARGVRTYFWRRDIPIGDSWKEIEAAQLNSARTVVVFLGSHGWGPNHLPLTLEAQRLKKRIIPVVIGEPPKDAFSEAGGLFETSRYLVLRDDDPGTLSALVEAIRRGNGAQQFAGLVSTLVDGSDDQRFEVLQQIVNGTFLDKPALSDRLREEIQFRFGPERESQFASAERDPKKIASIRSWMLSCLIWTGAEETSNRELLLKHLQADFEIDRNVRFWTLAGLHQFRATYLEDAAERCFKDPALEVASLASAIARPADPGLISRFRSMLSSDEFETAWAILRLLRVLPIQELAKEVCAQLDRSAAGTRLTYDTLYALANPVMAAQAVPILRESPGLKGIVAIVLAVAPNSDRNALRHFAMLLAAFELAAIERALAEAEKDDPAAGSMIRLLRRYIRQSHRIEAASELFVAGFASDTINVERDDLDIREDVQTLAAVMLAREVTPPLAIGLFGDWGTGKSFFMQSMKAAAKRIADAAKGNPDSKFCAEVVPVEFNAWHYVDTNLWASLVTHILESLAAHVAPSLTPEEQQAVLVKELQSAKSVVTQIESERDKTHEQIKERQSELEKLQLTRQQKELELRDLRLADLQTLLAEQPDLKRSLDESLQQMGVPAALTNISDLGQAMSEVNSLRGRVTALLIGLFTAQNKAVVIGLVAALIVLPFLAAWLYEHFSNSFVVVGTIVAEATVLIGGAVTFLRKAAEYVKTHLEKVERAKQQVDKLLAQKRKTPSSQETTLEQEIVSLKVKEEQVSSRMRAATEKVIDLEQRITSLKESRSLTRFLTERTQSDDYRKHLGLISTVRRDFEALRNRLVTSLAEPGVGRVERIILYVDDLDRCPADKVVDVLQAVHLLLAYPLFVVVVGVDPRWLTHSLTATYAAFKGGGEAPVKRIDDAPIKGAGEVAIDPDLWRTTPQNYLEKIFQIPVSLRPMTAAGYARLVQGLFSPRAPAKETSAEPAPAPRPDGQGSDSVPLSTTEGRQPDPVDLGAEKKSNGDPNAAHGEGFTIHEDALVIKPVEADFAERLYRLLPTPRATKRFSNIYRLLKAPTPPEQLQSFEGSEQVPGTFQVPMLLLAILIGMPTEAAALFPKLYERVASGRDPIEEFAILEAPGVAAEKISLLRERVSEIAADKSFPRSPELFVHWLPRVSRFSFEIGRAINPALVAQTRI